MKGYMRNIGLATSVTAKFWAIRDGLTLASQLGISHLVVELDSKIVIDLVLSNNTSNIFYTPLLNDYMSLLTHY